MQDLMQTSCDYGISLCSIRMVCTDSEFQYLMQWNDKLE